MDKIEEEKKSEDKMEDDLEQLNFIYLFRYPFAKTAFKWGSGIGSIMALHSYFTFSKLKRKPNKSSFYRN